MSRRTPLYEQHLKLHAKMVDFAGWEMPIQYGSLIEEHHAVRKNAGMFDVSHMGVVDIQGSDAQSFLQYLLANDVARLTLEGKALYTCMLNHEGGILDDLIVYYVKPNSYRIVVNAGTREKDINWMQQQAASFSHLEICERPELAIIAVQGPKARERVNALFTDSEQQQLAPLKLFQGTTLGNIWLARTGYTGEEGYEIILPAQEATDFWQKLITQGVSPCGLGARDTLRLEAGLNLYGSDMNASTTPLESNLAWTIAFDPSNRKFIGRDALEKQKEAGLRQQLYGLVLQQSGVMRAHQKVMIEGIGEGEITSGSFSPTMGKSIALARLPVLDLTQTHSCFIDIRGKWVAASIVAPPFVRNGKIMIV